MITKNEEPTCIKVYFGIWKRARDYADEKMKEKVGLTRVDDDRRKDMDRS